jgi:hypothetical protein
MRCSYALATPAGNPTAKRFCHVWWRPVNSTHSRLDPTSIGITYQMHQPFRLAIDRLDYHLPE